MSLKPILYSTYTSSCSWRVRIALALKGVEYVNKIVKKDGKQLTRDFLSVNPLSQVPVLVENGNVLLESMAIIEYIDEVYNRDVPLLPKDPILRSKARAIALTIVSGIQPQQKVTNLLKLAEINPKESIKIEKSWPKKWMDSKFEGLEILLSQTSGKCCVGDDITAADICLVPQVSKAYDYGVDMKPFPIISRINEYLSSIDAIKRGHPSELPGFPQK